jgi:arthrofactin-type cyclic lipopeptide synthetase C
MFRFALARLGGDRHVLSLAADHLVADGWSVGVLLTDVVTAYENPGQLEQPALRSVDHAAWLRTVLSGDRLERQMSWWQQKLAGLRSRRPGFLDERDLDVSVRLKPRLIER